ncbi:MAG: 2-amino-4-hydroxy-6-hydroxymethyldihydropteridine diphosphokinase [Acetivibrio sp.]
MDKIKISDLEIYCRHGLLKEETILGQKFLVSLTMFLDISKAGKTDKMEDSISYAEVAHFVETFMKERTFKLLEAVAETLAEEVLLRFEKIQKVKIEIKKPWAPILLPLDTVSVEIQRGWHKAYLALGSNMGNKEENLYRAITLLNQDKNTRVRKVSSFIITKPMGEVEQDDFLNGAVEVDTLRDPEELLTLVHEIEEDCKRVRTIRWGPRTLDVDILFYDNLVIRTKELQIPHIGVKDRDFVLIPLEEIAPLVIHPLLGKNIYQLKKDLQPL